MHEYLRAIGFSQYLNREEMRELIEECVGQADKLSVAEEEHYVFGEANRDVGPNMGICVCGEYNDADELEVDYYFPYFRGTGITSYEEISITKRIASDSYEGICDDVRVGISLIFYLQNPADYKNALRLFPYNMEKELSVTLSGLSVSGSILLPVTKTKEQVLSDKKADLERHGLIAKARQGDEEAIESLTMEDMDMYSMISRRIQREDLFTIVDSYFMPYGIECDLYSVLGEILEVELHRNFYTQEEIYLLRIDCKGMVFDVCINKQDLLGEPMEGRRFKGNIWLQGYLNYS